MRLIFILILLVGCGPRSPKDCCKQGEGVARALTKELQAIETREDLIAHQEQLSRLYLELAEVMIRAEKASQKWVERPEEFNAEVNEKLKRELLRVYQIPGAREIVEQSQKEALYKLDGFFEKYEAKRSA